MSSRYFNKALSDFTIDFASGAEIRAFADKGYTVSQIKEKLDFPTSLEKVKEIVWKHYVDTGVILLSEPTEGSVKERISYEKVYDRFGKMSFKQVVTKDDDLPKEYVACDFGKLLYKDKSAFEKSLNVLSADDKDYILDLPWPLESVWHIKNERMDRIMNLLGL